MKILVSACLLGKNCKYSGGNNYNQKVVDFISKNASSDEILEVCPEVMAGLSTPRKPIEVLDNRVIREDGLDLTDKINNALKELKEMTLDFKPDLAILKARSPSCGHNGIYDGTFTKKIVNKNGKACDLLLELGVKVLSEEEI